MARTFLENLSIPLAEDDIVAVSDDPPAVLYKIARFEIKEILDSGRIRHDEYKQELEKARRAKTTNDHLENYTPKDCSLSEVFEKCLNRMKVIGIKYSPRIRANMVLLFICEPTTCDVRN